MDNLILAHQKASRGKTWYSEVKMVNDNPKFYLKQLQEMLINKTFKTSEYEVFMRFDSGKEREIYKLPYFPDRICQWALMLVIEPYIVRNLTKDTYSAIPGRGTQLCVEQIQKAIANDPEGTTYCLKIDVKKFYPSINHSILKSKYRRLFKDADVLWLLDEIIDSTDGDTGIPIGNYLSQYSGNFYLSKLDHWVKEDMQIKYYYRYMDDMVILGSNKADLHHLRKSIDDKLHSVLALTMKATWQVFPTFVRGIDFCGYRVFKNFTLLRKSTAKEFKRKMKAIRRKVSAGYHMSHSEWCSFNSYRGWLKHCDSYRLYQKHGLPIEPYSKQYYQLHIKGAK